MERAADSADVTIVSSYVGQVWNATSASAPQPFTNFINDLVKRGRRLIVLSFGNPYLLQQIPAAPTYVVAWGGSQGSQSAAARALLGITPITGKLPISIPFDNGARTILRGAGIMRPSSTK